MIIRTPKRNDIVILDFEPTKNKKIGNRSPALVLSGEEYNRKTGLLICCPISTNIRGCLTEVPIVNLNSRSIVCSAFIQTLSWRDRRVKFLCKAKDGVIEAVQVNVITLIGGTPLFD